MITFEVDGLEQALRRYRDGLGLPTYSVTGTDYEGGKGTFRPATW